MTAPGTPDWTNGSVTIARDQLLATLNAAKGASFTSATLDVTPWSSLLLKIHGDWTGTPGGTPAYLTLTWSIAGLALPTQVVTVPPGDALFPIDCMADVPCLGDSVVVKSLAGDANSPALSVSVFGSTRGLSVSTYLCSEAGAPLLPQGGSLAADPPGAITSFWAGPCTYGVRVAIASNPPSTDAIAYVADWQGAWVNLRAGGVNAVLLGGAYFDVRAPGRAILVQIRNDDAAAHTISFGISELGP